MRSSGYGRCSSDSITIELPNGDKVKNTYTSHHTTYNDNRYLGKIQIADLEQWKDINPYYINAKA